MARFRLRRDRSSAGAPEGGAEGGQAGAQPQTGQGAEATPAPEPTMPERIEGLRAWVAQLDRRIGVRTYAGAAALVLALAAAAVALVLVLQLRDEAATDSDVQGLRDEIAGVEDTATEAAQEDVQSLSDRLGEIESQTSEIASDQDSVDQEISVIQDDIQDLRDQISEVDTGGAGGAGGAAADSP